MLGRPTVFALGLAAGIAVQSSYSCVRARAGEALEMAGRARTHE